MAQPDPEPVFPVGFDEDAVNEDLKRLPESATTALASFRENCSAEPASPRIGSSPARPKAGTARCSAVASRPMCLGRMGASVPSWLQ